MTAKEFLLTDPKIKEAVSKGYDIRLDENEWLEKMEQYTLIKQKLIKHSIGGKRPDFKTVLAQFVETGQRNVGKGCNYERYILERDFTALLDALSEAACASGVVDTVAEDGHFSCWINLGGGEQCKELCNECSAEPALKSSDVQR